MSWFQDLAGKAETILTKIDQNAANVLQQQQNQKNGIDDVEPLIEVTVGPSNNLPSIPRIPSKGALLLTKISTPKKTRQEKNGETLSIQDDGGSIKSEKQQNNSNISSRRSSFSSRHEGTVIETDLETSKSSYPQTSFSVERELSATKIVLAEVKSERDELKQELENIMEQLNNVDNERKFKELESFCESLSGDKNDLMNKLSTIEEANAKYVKSLCELESTVSKHLQVEMEQNQKLEMAKIETDQAVSELQQYRLRAQTTLQLKEKMIEQLKNSPLNPSENHSPNKSEQILTIELEQLKNERSNLLDEIKMLNERVDQSKLNSAIIEAKYKSLNEEWEGKLSKMQSSLSLETTKWLQLEDDLKIQTKELTSAREEMTKQRTSFSLKLHEKESEIKKLKSRIYNRPISPSNDLEERLHSLTQSLVQKQTTLESVTAERNALRLQLEKLDNQHQSTITQIRQQRIQIINANETDDAKSQVPNFMAENPFDTKVARRVKRAYSTLDSVGIRLGVFLRRYPLVRILVIVYVVMLHLWVILVLFSSTPN